MEAAEFIKLKLVVEQFWKYNLNVCRRRLENSKEIKEKSFISTEHLLEIKKFYIKIMEHEKFNFDCVNL